MLTSPSPVDYTALQVEHAVLNAEFGHLQKKYARLVEREKMQARANRLFFDALLACATSSFLSNLLSQLELHNASADTLYNRIVGVRTPIHLSPSDKGRLLLLLVAFVLVARHVFNTRFVAFWQLCAHATYVYLQAEDVVFSFLDSDQEPVGWVSFVIPAVVYYVYCSGNQ
jgi:hypothetical protein